ncbi:DUF4157 domain-containing protein [Actinomadura miaoliensis]|uniref:eCIS core domain-containing protein n=1 Tax=Actinomadura miaoliensis TaxID=430685 RepID=A0ABP7WT40_9ACTN
MTLARTTRDRRRTGTTAPPPVPAAHADRHHADPRLLQRQLGNTLVAALSGASPGRTGRPLDAATRALMEARFGHDFGAVRVHDGPAAARSAADLDAAAYTVGHSVVLGGDGYAPGTAAGRRVLAHELAHVVQQAPQPTADGRRAPSPPATAEREAHAAAEAAALGRPFRIRERLAPGTVARQPATPSTADVAAEDDRRLAALGITRQQLIDWATLPKGDFIGKYGLRFWWNFPRDQVRALPGSLLQRVLPQEDQTLYMWPSGRVSTVAEERSARVAEYRPPGTPLAGVVRGTALLAGARPETAEALGEAAEVVGAGLPLAAAGLTKGMAARKTQPAAPPRPTAKPTPPAPTTPPPAPTATTPPAPATTPPQPATTAPPAPTTPPPAPTTTAPPMPTTAPATAPPAPTTPPTAPRTTTAPPVPGTAVPPAPTAPPPPAPAAPPAPTTTAPPSPAPAATAPPVPAAEAKPVYTPPERQLPPHVEPPPEVPFARNVASYGERVVEPEVLRLRPRARPMSAKAIGFDAHEGARVVGVTTTQERGTTVVDESISGGNWIQVKGVSAARVDLVRRNVDESMAKAADALKFARRNSFEKTGPKSAYRTTYAGPPDRITIFLRLRSGAVTPELDAAAKKAVEDSAYKSDLPPVDVFILGY